MNPIRSRSVCPDSASCGRFIRGFAAASAAAVVAAAVGATGVAAAPVKIFKSEGRETVLSGTLDGVAVDPLGGIELARQLQEVSTIDEPFAFAAAARGDAWVVGTGNSGRVLEVGADGVVRELFAAEEPEIFAVRVDDDGAVLAGSSPFGKVYRITEAGAEVIFEPGDAYIWALARDTKGRLLVATGLPGRLHRIARDGTSQVLIESQDSHVRALQPLPDGDVLAGTAGLGLILRHGADGSLTTVHDAVQPEVLAFAAAEDGTVYAAVLASEASQVDLSKSQATSDAGGSEAVVTVQEAVGTIGSRSTGFSGPRSVLLEIGTDGRVEEVARFQDETVHALLWRRGDLWVGTGEDGRLFRWTPDGVVLERELDESQITALVAGKNAIGGVTTNAASVFRLADRRESRGIYTSPVLDAGQVARFGAFVWHGELHSGSVALAARSGMSAEPDATWTAWQDLGTDRETSLDGIAHGRYVQWRATLSGNGPHIATAELSYRQENIRPEITEIAVLDPGEILVPNSFNPGKQTYEPWSPNRDGIFTTLRDAADDDDGRLKTLWKSGYRTLRWKAEDRNDDELVYRLSFRADGAKGEDAWLAVAEEVEEAWFSFDATVLPDGVYRFRVEASDRPSQPPERVLTADRTSAAIVVDHTPPTLVEMRRRGGAIEVELADERSPLRDAVFSVDAGDWQQALPADGLLDGRRETLRLDVPDDARLLLLRVTDAAWNVVTLNLLEAAR